MIQAAARHAEIGPGLISRIAGELQKGTAATPPDRVFGSDTLHDQNVCQFRQLHRKELTVPAGILGDSTRARARRLAFDKPSTWITGTFFVRQSSQSA
jgi:hypothetical protein